MKKPIVLGIILLILILSPIVYFTNKKINQKVGEKIMEKVIESQTGAKVNIDSNSNGGDITIKTEDGQTQYSAGGGVKLPDSFPQELIVVDDAKLIMASSSDNGSSVTYFTNYDQTTIFEKYINDLVRLGWKKEMEVNTDQGKMINISKENEGAVITIGDNSSKDTTAKNTVNIIWTKDK
jgi:hypothetical protein